MKAILTAIINHTPRWYRIPDKTLFIIFIHGEGNTWVTSDMPSVHANEDSAWKCIQRTKPDNWQDYSVERYVRP